MSEAEGPVQVSAKAVAEVNGEPTYKSVTFGFDPRQGPLTGFDPKEPNKKPAYVLVEALDQLRDAGSQPVDARLDRIGHVVCDSFDEGTNEVRSIDVALPGSVRRRFQDQTDIVRLLGDLNGIRAERRKAGPIGKMAVTIRYTKSGKAATLSETFSLNETIVRGDNLEVDIAPLADKLKRDGSPVPELP